MICLGYYSRQHAKEHFEVSGHALSIELATGRVWDYASDVFVHSHSSNAMLLVVEPEEGRGSCREDSRRGKGAGVAADLDAIAQHHLDPVTTAKLDSLGTEYEVR